MFRVRVTATDGVAVGVTVQIDDHPAEARPYVLNDIADRWRLPREQILTVLKEWTYEQLVAHLQSFPSKEIKPPALRHR